MNNTLKKYVQLVVERIRSQSFNLNSFKKMSGEEALEYARKNLSKLGQGSSREVYVLTSDRVLKIAKNEKGNAQNEQEIDVFTNPLTKPIMTKILDYDKNFNWIICDLVNPFKDDPEIEKALGIGLNDTNLLFPEFVFTVLDSTEREYRKYVPDHLMPMAKAIKSVAFENDLIAADLAKASSWGQDSDGRIVLLDYGYSNDVHINHYSN